VKSTNYETSRYTIFSSLLSLPLNSAPPFTNTRIYARFEVFMAKTKFVYFWAAASCSMVDGP